MRPMIKPVQLTRRRLDAPLSWGADGRPVAGPTTDTPFTASVQPMPGKDRKLLPEGVRSREAYRLTTDPGVLRTVDQHAGHEADLVLLGSDLYEVAHAEPRAHGLIPHDRVYIVRVDERGGAE